MNTNNQTIVIRNEILSGIFDSDGYRSCKFVFENCKFVNFEFDSSENAVLLVQGNELYENVRFNASQIKIKNEVGCANLNSFILSGDRVELEPNLKINAYNRISIYANNGLQLQNLYLSSSIIDIQSTYELTSLKNCKILTEQGCKITNTQGGLEIKSCKIKNTKAQLEDDGKRMNGIIIQSFYQNGILRIEQTKLGTDVVEIYHPAKVYIDQVNIQKVTESGRLSIHGNRNICYNYIESDLDLTRFINNTTSQKSIKNTSKIKQLLKLVS